MDNPNDEQWRSNKLETQADVAGVPAKEIQGGDWREGLKSDVSLVLVFVAVIAGCYLVARIDEVLSGIDSTDREYNDCVQRCLRREWFKVREGGIPTKDVWTEDGTHGLVPLCPGTSFGDAPDYSVLGPCLESAICGPECASRRQQTPEQ